MNYLTTMKIMRISRIAEDSKGLRVTFDKMSVIAKIPPLPKMGTRFLGKPERENVLYFSPSQAARIKAHFEKKRKVTVK